MLGNCARMLAVLKALAAAFLHAVNSPLSEAVVDTSQLLGAKVQANVSLATYQRQWQGNTSFTPTWAGHKTGGVCHHQHLS